MRPRKVRLEGFELKGLQVITDDRLDTLARKFQKGRMRELLRISFLEYIADADRYDRTAEALHSGQGLQRIEGNLRFQLVAV